MNDYLLIDSADPYGGDGPVNDLAVELKDAGSATTVFLVQDAVSIVRGVKRSRLAEFRDRGINVVCDEFSLRERGLYEAAVEESVAIVGVDLIVDHLARQSRVIWL